MQSIETYSIEHNRHNLTFDFIDMLTKYYRWNSAKEDQCQNRIHRFGQLAPVVRVRKFIINDSVEERIVELQQRKAYVAEEIYSDVGRSGDIESARLTLDDFRLIFRSK
jgi:SNF2 family DNA or RNA helicase